MGRAAALILSLAALGVLSAGLIWAGFSLANVARNAVRRWRAGNKEKS